MTTKEIMKSFEQAGNKRTQVETLSDLNGCSQLDILKILIVAGANITGAVPKKNQEYTFRMICSLLDETEAEIKAAEEKYKRIANCLMQWKG